MNAEQFADDTVLESGYPDHISALKSRHDSALERAGAAHAVIFSGAPLPVFLDDYHYPFKANPHFVSWLPLTGNPHCYIVYTPGRQTDSDLLPGGGLLALAASQPRRLLDPAV